jgi:hypothetical protein
MADEQACVVCGQGSHRDKWAKSKTVNGQVFVACDGHTDKEFADAVARALPQAPAASK